MKRILIALAVTVPLLSGCEGMKARQQDRCQIADWAQIGERDGVEIANQNLAMQRGRYQSICGDMFKADAYEQGLAKGVARRPAPTGR